MAEHEHKLVDGRYRLRKLFKVGAVWHCRIVDERTGKTHKRSTRCKRRIEAERQALAIINEIRQVEDEDVEPVNGTRFDVAFAEFLDLKDIRESTRQVYQYDLDGVYAPAFGGQYVDEISFADVGRFLKRLANRGQSSRSRSRHLTALRSFFRWAARMGYARTNPCDGHKVPRGEKREGQALAFDDAKRLLEAARTPVVQKLKTSRTADYERTVPPPQHLHVAIALALYTGLRRGNVSSLTWRQVDLGARKITISGEEMKAKRDHVVPIHPALERLLRGLLRGKKRVPADANVLGGDFSIIRNSYKSALRRADIDDDLRWHDLRHTFASWMAPRCSYAALKRLMAHSPGNDVTLTYTHVPWEELLAAVDSLPDIIGDARKLSAEASS